MKIVDYCTFSIEYCLKYLNSLSAVEVIPAVIILFILVFLLFRIIYWITKDWNLW